MRLAINLAWIRDGKANVAGQWAGEVVKTVADDGFWKHYGFGYYSIGTRGSIALLNDAEVFFAYNSDGCDCSRQIVGDSEPL